MSKNACTGFLQKTRRKKSDNYEGVEKNRKERLRKVKLADLNAIAMNSENYK